VDQPEENLHIARERCDAWLAQQRLARAVGAL